MRKLLPFILLFLSLFALAASAQQQCTQYRWNDGGTESGEWVSDISSACSAAYARWSQGWQYGGELTACALSGIQMKRNPPPDWPYPTFYNALVQTRQVECGNQCSATAGEVKTLNFTVCYSRAASGGSCATTANQLPAGSTACNSGCEVTLGSAQAAWASQARTDNGLYRYSLDISTTGTDKACTTQSPALDSSPTAAPPCPGSLGTVNGQPYCAGTAANPVAGDQPKPGDVPPTNGNPPAGAGTGSGTGPGRTPATGGGGPEGGPAGATGSGTTVINNNGSPTGTTTKPGEGTEQANCGAPGQPKCALDESGTPKVQPGQWDGAADAYKTSRDTNRGTMSGSGDKGFFAGWTSFWFAPPIATCVPFALPSIMGMALDSINPCAIVEGVRTIMGYIWALLALALCVAMIGRTIRGTA